MQSIMIATTNTQKNPTPTFNSLTSKTLLKSNYIKSYTSIFQKHGKTIQIFHTLYKLYKSLGTEKKVTHYKVHTFEQSN